MQGRVRKLQNQGSQGHPCLARYMLSKMDLTKVASTDDFWDLIRVLQSVRDLPCNHGHLDLGICDAFQNRRPSLCLLHDTWTCILRLPQGGDFLTGTLACPKFYYRIGTHAWTFGAKLKLVQHHEVKTWIVVPCIHRESVLQNLASNANSVVPETKVRLCKRLDLLSQTWLGAIYEIKNEIETGKFAQFVFRNW